MYNLNQFVMIKKHLLGGALLVSVLVLLTGCKEFMSSIDNAVDSHLQVISTPVVGVDKTYQIAKDVDYKTISDADARFESLDKAIATVDSKTGVVSGVKSGDARIKISLPDNGLYLDASAIINVKVRVQNVEQLKKDIVGNDVKSLLAEGAEINLTEALDLSGKKVSIIGDQEKPATIIAKAGFIVTTKGFSLENVNIDATDLEKGLIQMGDTTGTGVHNKVLLKDAPRYSDMNQDVWLLQDAISVKGCMIKNLATPILDVQNYNWGIDELTIEDNIIQMNNNANEFIKLDNDARGNGGKSIIKMLNIKKNTIYNLKDNANRFFIKGSNSSNTQTQKIYGEPNGSDTGFYQWTFSQNTIIKSFTQKKFANNTPNVKAARITLNDNIFVDVKSFCSFKTGSVTMNVDKTTNFFHGVNVTIDNSDKTYFNEADPGFTAPTTALDFTKKNGGLNLKPSGDAKDAGDPRWLK
jgi:hypothetical protein